MAHAVLTTMLMKNKDIDAMNRVAFIGAAGLGNSTVPAPATSFIVADADQATIVKMDKMVEFSGYNEMLRDKSVTPYNQDVEFGPTVSYTQSTTTANYEKRSFGSGHGEGYSFTATKAPADSEGDLWIVDNHEVAYTVEYQQRVTIDPRKFCNEAGRSVSVRKLSKGDIIQVNADAFSAGNTPDLTSQTKKTKVVIDANGKLKAVTAPGENKNAVFNVIGMQPMEFGLRFDDAWILEATQYAD